MEFIVIAAHTSNYPDPIQFLSGDELILGRRDDNYPGWIWVTIPSGKAGWAPESLIDVVAPGRGVARAAYTARELNTSAGERVTVQYELDNWLWVANERGEAGWIPKETVRPAQ